MTSLPVLALAGSAFATQARKKTPPKKTSTTSTLTSRLEAEIKAIDLSAQAITLGVKEGSKDVDYKLETNAQTKFMNEGRAIQMSALKVG